MIKSLKIMVFIICLAGIVFSQSQGLYKDINFRTDSDEGKKFNRQIETNMLLKGSVLKLKDNTYWVKDGTINSVNGEVLVNFDKKLTINGKSVINQVDANYGYILELVQDKNTVTTFYIWIANSKGERDSDDIIIEVK